MSSNIPIGLKLVVASSIVFVSLVFSSLFLMQELFLLLILQMNPIQLEECRFVK